MLPAKSTWCIHQIDEAEVDAFVQQTGVQPVVARLLLIRGIEAAEANRFLQADKESLYDPFLLDGMQRAVDRIQEAIAKEQLIRIYGDYDADGVTSTAIVVRVFRHLGARFDYYIPDRIHEGYGINVAAIDDAKEQGVSLIVTVDNGISAKTEIDYARSLGIDVVVTDHHEPPERLPDAAVACVNPRMPQCSYPFKGLAGAGVAWKLACALCGEADVPSELIELAAIGTIADLMPMLDENRIIVRTGLKQMQSTRLPGLRAIYETAGIAGQTIDESHIGFAVGPRINAAGRLAHADLALQLLITDDTAEAVRLSDQLDQLNKQRQKVVEELTEKALAQAEQQDPADRVIVIAGESWHVGVVGIVASRIVDRRYRPVVVLSIDPDTGIAKGSARSIDGYDIHKALTACDDLLDHYGGHQAAGGMSLQQENIASLRARLNELADEWLEPDQLVPRVEADFVFSVQDISLDTIEEIAKLAPFGIGNRAPRFVFNHLLVEQSRILGKTGKHLKLTVRAADASAPYSNIDALAFGAAELVHWITPWAKISIYGELDINEWNGRRSPQIRVSELSVNEQQVFDWRRVRDGAEQWQNWLAASKRADDHVKPVILGDVSEERLHTYGIEAVCSSYEAFAQHEAVTDLILYSLPPDLPTLKAALHHFQQVKRLIVWLPDVPDTSQPLPSRNQFKQVYGWLKQQGEIEWDGPAKLQRLSNQLKVRADTIQFIMQVFRELEFIQVSGTKVMLHPAPTKRELHTSTMYQEREQKQKLEQFLRKSTGKELATWLLNQLSAQNNRDDEAIQPFQYIS